MPFRHDTLCITCFLTLSGIASFWPVFHLHCVIVPTFLTSHAYRIACLLAPCPYCLLPLDSLLIIRPSCCVTCMPVHGYTFLRSGNLLLLNSVSPISVQIMSVKKRFCWEKKAIVAGWLESRFPQPKLWGRRSHKERIHGRNTNSQVWHLSPDWAFLILALMHSNCTSCSLLVQIWPFISTCANEQISYNRLNIVTVTHWALHVWLRAPCKIEETLVWNIYPDAFKPALFYLPSWANVLPWLTSPSEKTFSGWNQFRSAALF